MKKLIMLIPLFAILVGCTTNRTPEAVVYDSFRTTYRQTRNAYSVLTEAYIKGKVSETDKLRADTAWNQFREVFKASLLVASSDWSKPVSPTVKVYADNFNNLTASLTH